MAKIWSFLLLQKRNDREEIRRRLAMGVETEDGQELDKIGKKPSLHSRLQSGIRMKNPHFSIMR